ncbi:MAG: 4-(cytidine 5'-diphospho)-2-C-methyl-D-erythritol kinase [Eggerthellaceae bacterium]|nr:4-(cytidine 5'-diphospho)-2-C-methyl-D-erythritol kinase [Eggerthellaceae bacterium]
MTSQKMEVDIIGAARDAQWNPDTFLGPGSIKLLAPAKVNLFLVAGALRENSLHEVTTVMQALSLHDTLYMNSENYEDVYSGFAEISKASEQLAPWQAIGGPDDNILVSIDVSEHGLDRAWDVPAQKNHIFKAIDLLARMASADVPQKIAVHLDKVIPLEGGLGGGSSDAAAALLGCAHIWGLEPDDERIYQCAKAIGSDMSFFLRGGCCLFDGYGENYVKSLAPLKEPVALIKPSCGIPTARAYARFDEDPCPADEDDIEKALQAESARDVPLINNLTDASCSICPDIEEVISWAKGQPHAEHALMSGSGSCVAVLADTFNGATGLCADARLKGWWSRATTFSSLRAARVPT